MSPSKARSSHHFKSAMHEFTNAELVILGVVGRLRPRRIQWAEKKEGKRRSALRNPPRRATHLAPRPRVVPPSLLLLLLAPLSFPAPLRSNLPISLWSPLHSTYLSPASASLPFLRCAVFPCATTLFLFLLFLLLPGGFWSMSDQRPW